MSSIGRTFLTALSLAESPPDSDLLQQAWERLVAPRQALRCQSARQAATPSKQPKTAHWSPQETVRAAADASWRLGMQRMLTLPASCRRRSFLTKLDIHGDTHPGLWERFNRMIDRLTPRKNERSNHNDAASG